MIIAKEDHNNILKEKTLFVATASGLIGIAIGGIIVLFIFGVKISNEIAAAQAEKDFYQEKIEQLQL